MDKRIKVLTREPPRSPTATQSMLTACLDHTHHLLSDVALAGHPDPIEHIVLSEHGIFVLELRDWTGRISCIGDNWVNNGKTMPSPSHHVKDAARAIRTVLLTSGVLHHPNLWVDGVIVLLNENIDLNTKFNHVPIRKLTELCDYLTTTHTGFYLSQPELMDVQTLLMNSKRPERVS